MEALTLQASGDMEERVIKRRKKLCTCCGKKKWLRDFYMDRNNVKDGRACHCKECSRRKHREWYLRTRKVPDGIIVGHTGKKFIHAGFSRKVYWDGNMLSIMKRHYPRTLNDEMVELLGCMVSKSTIIRKARKMGLEKDPEWLRQVREERHLMAQAENRKNGNSGMFKPGRKFTGNQYTGRINQ